MALSKIFGPGGWRNLQNGMHQYLLCSPSIVRAIKMCWTVNGTYMRGTELHTDFGRANLK